MTCRIGINGWLFMGSRELMVTPRQNSLILLNIDTATSQELPETHIEPNFYGRYEFTKRPEVINLEAIIEELTHAHVSPEWLLMG
jgi:hypothetical protein